MRLTLFLILLLIHTLATATEAINVGKAYAIDSNVLNEERAYYVYLPPSYAAKDRTFPIIYLLDGDEHRFKGFVGILESLSTNTLDNQVQQAIVIAVPNTDRSRDLTPSTLREWTFKGRVLDTFETSGKADQFTLFLKQELIPYINATYKVSGKNVLVGESFGGLFAANSVLKTTTLFNDYIIIDPTALWDNDYLNRTLVANGPDKPYPANVFFAFANNSRLGEIGLTNYKWGSGFATALSSRQSVSVTQRYFESETHETVALLGWYYGLKTLLPAASQ